jgi:hypothetical protein
VTPPWWVPPSHAWPGQSNCLCTMYILVFTICAWDGEHRGGFHPRHT